LLVTLTVDKGEADPVVSIAKMNFLLSRECDEASDSVGVAVGYMLG
jgi:hypothetical protein